ncbi:MAG TPA: carboxylesterase/lipase family protein [Rhizomicrobium sp.]|nr:carboxylesterase/lipase family protein [Rhizomicrobium sp.]
MDRPTGKTEDATVETEAGRLKGLAQDGVSAFRGIPYATAARWQMPQLAPPWAGIRDATRFGPVSPQGAMRMATLSGGPVGAQSEDCLNLNVWTPGCDNAKRPVMLWLHGGAFVFGAGSQGIYDGRRLAARDVVVVTINYRLGAFGFLALDDATDGRAPGTGAEGIADQILALTWVKQNIACFGGDPDNVTVFGESAGAMSVNALLASPAAQGLFHKAIAQSGGGHIGHDRERAARVARTLLDTLGIAPADARRLLDIPFPALVEAQGALLAGARAGRYRLGGLPFQPAVDNATLPLRPIDAVRAGAAKGIPLLTGTTREEWKLFTALDPRLRFMSVRNLSQRVTRLAHDVAPALLAAYEEGSPFTRFTALMTDKAFTMPATRLLEAQAAHAPAYAYRFDWRSRLLGGMFGSCHALELGFVFGTHDDKRAGLFFGKGPAADALSATMIDAWTAFARTGDPGWPRYDTHSRETMIFGDGPPRAAAAPDEARRKVWDAFPDRKLGP